MGKNWAQGLTKDTDARVARAANAHRGLHYIRRTPTELCKWLNPQRVITEWSNDLAYAVGLIATDGCLGQDGSTITLVSNDRQLLETYLHCLGRSGSIRPHGGRASHVVFTDVRFHAWLRSIGISPRKSLTLGAIDTPEQFLLPLVRGLLDGDGSVKYETVVPNPRRYPRHVYPRISVLFHSASWPHVDWIASRLSLRLGINGRILVQKQNGGNPLYALKYAKHASIILLSHLYEESSSPRLERKWQTWQRYRHEARPTRIWTKRRRSTPTAEGADSKPA